jgi:hypothetical protein
MLSRTLIFFTAIFSHFLMDAQKDFEFVGVIRLAEDAFISYKISFDEREGLVTGYSLTDLGGEHETKSYLSGYFDDVNNTLEFYESGIIYTKSFITQDDFCFIHFNGSLRKLNEQQSIEGKFKGLYSDGKECISGELKLANLGKMLKKAKKLDRKIDRNILISQEDKDKVNIVKELDSLSMNTLKKNETLTIFSKSNKITMSIYDAGLEDGDKIALYLNDQELYRSIEARAAIQKIEVPLKKEKDVIKIVALTNGTVGGNTIKIDLYDGDNIIETLTNMKAGESAQFVFLRQK